MAAVAFPLPSPPLLDRLHPAWLVVVIDRIELMDTESVLLLDVDVSIGAESDCREIPIDWPSE